MDETVLRKLPNLEQLAYIKRAEVDGAECYLIKNKTLSLTVTRKGLDIYDLSYRGINFSWLGSCGMASPEAPFHHRFRGGFLYTCGLDHIGAADNKHGFHGRISGIPASVFTAKADFSGEEPAIILQGEIEQNTLFGARLTLERKYVFNPGGFTLSDTVVNRGYESTDAYIMYHFNLGYPVVDEGTRLLLNAKSVKPVGSYTQKNIDNRFVFPAPDDTLFEECYLYELPDGLKENTVSVINEKADLRADFIYNTKYLSAFTHWKCYRSGEYALGVEPSSAMLDERKKPFVLAPGERAELSLKISFSGGNAD